MPEKLFFQLADDKQMKILAVGISEFAAYGYTNSSTNRIVKNCGISKGSLFKYFSTKEDLYFYVLDTVTADFIESLEKMTSGLSSDLFQRVIEYSALEFTWYIQNPEKAELIINAFAKSNAKMYQKTIEQYGSKELDIYQRLTKDISLHNFKWDKQKTTDILRWFLKGFNEDFLDNVRIDKESFQQIQDKYVESLTEYMELLKAGLLK